MIQMHKLVIITIAMAMLFTGCAPYKNNFSCEQQKGAGRNCKPAVDNLGFAERKEENRLTEEDKLSYSTGDSAADNLRYEQYRERKESESKGESGKGSGKDSVQANMRVEADSLTKDLTTYKISYDAKINRSIITPAKTLNVTILPYLDDRGRFHKIKDVEILLKEPRFVMGDYVVKKSGFSPRLTTKNKQIEAPVKEEESKKDSFLKDYKSVADYNAVVSTDVLVVRKDPIAKSATIAKLKRDKKVKILETTKYGWSKVEFGGNTAGWVSSVYLRSSEG